MKLLFLNLCSKGYVKVCRKICEELDQEVCDRKCQKKCRGYVSGSCVVGGNIMSGSKGQNVLKDLCIGSKIFILLGVIEKVIKQYKLKSEKFMFLLQVELELLEMDECLDVLLECLEVGEILSVEE